MFSSIIRVTTGCIVMVMALQSSMAVAAEDLVVRVRNAVVNGGPIYVGIFSSSHQKDFPLQFDKINDKDVLKSKATTVLAHFYDLNSPDRYAGVAFQDRNGNGRLDFNGNVPAEPFGITNVSGLVVFDRNMSSGTDRKVSASATFSDAAFVYAGRSRLVNIILK